MRLFKFFLHILCILSLTVSPVSAAGPTEFAEIPWGSTAAAVQTAMEAREGVAFKGTEAGNLRFTGGTFANEPVSAWRLDFIGGKFRSGTVEFTAETAKDEKRFANDRLEGRVVRLIEQKYGKPVRTVTGNHRESNWTFADTLRPGWTRKIRFLHAWSPSLRLEVTYSEVPPTAPKKTKDI